MRVLLINNHCISDPTAGVTQSLRTIMEWLADAGHACQILTTARFESAVTFTLDEHLRTQGVSAAAGDSLIEYRVGNVPVTLVRTRNNDEQRPNAREAKRYLAQVDSLLDRFEPSLLIACNGHPMIFDALARARRRGITTAYAVRGFGYYDRRYFDHVNHAFTCSRFLTDHYRERIGLISTPLEPPLDWSSVVAPEDARAFVTFVNPSPHKGLYLFARLADMLGSRRPDIPILVIQSGQSGGALNAVRGVDFARYPQIMAAPPVAKPADYFALTRLLLVPSVWEEPFGRVAAEAMVNAIPPLVSNRGSLADVIAGDADEGGAGRVLPIPAWMTHTSRTLPDAHEIEPWLDAVCSLWDDPARYRTLARRGRAIADERYSEAVSRKKHLDYFASLDSTGRATAEHPTSSR